MKTVKEFERSLDIIKECDVCVCGGGIAGVAAAIAAARNGAKVILLEREYALGGLATLGLITIYLPMCDGLGHQAEYGIVEELLRLALKRGKQMDNTEKFFGDYTVEERANGARMTAQYNPNYMALELERLLVELGVDIQYGSLICGVTKKENNKIDTIIIENKEKRCAVQCKSVIDATGDSYIMEYADANRALYNGDNGLASWYYFNQDQKLKLRMFGLSDVVPEENESNGTAKDSEVDNVISGSRRYHPLKAEELSKMVIDGHYEMLKDMLKHEDKGNFEPTTISQIPLIRMSRRMDGEYVMDDKEIRVTMKDSVGTFCDWRKRGPVYELPFRCLYTKSVPNLLAAGRNISVTDEMWDIIRVIPACVVSGEAAGTAAALSDDFTTMDVTVLQEKLVKQGVRLHHEDILK